MKPSEKIKKIIEEKYKTSIKSRQICAILEYLDEEHEKNKPCEHKNSYQEESPLHAYNVCNDCGVLFLATPKENDQT